MPGADSGKRRALTMASHVLKLVVFATLLYLVSRLFEDQRLLQQAERLSLGSVIAFFSLMFAQRITVAIRWMLICRKQLSLEMVRWPFLLRLNLVAEFVVIWLPSSLVAEGVRLWRMRKLTGNLQLSAASIVFDRIFGLLGMIVCILPFLPAMQSSDKLAVSPLGMAMMLAAIAISAVVAISMLRGYQGSIPLLLRASELLDRIRILSSALLASCLSFGLIVIAHSIVYQELTELSWLQIVPLVLVPLLGRAIPISLFGVGAVEGGTLLLGGIMGVDSETLVLVAGLTVLSKYLSSTVGVIWEIAAEGWTGLSDALRLGPKEALDTADQGQLPEDTPT